MEPVYLQRLRALIGKPFEAGASDPGDRMILSGVVATREEQSREVEVEVRGVNRLGDHVTGSVRVALPEGAR